MRLAGILMFLFFAGKLSAQQRVITVFDVDTRLPVAGATVRSKLALTLTNAAGSFILNNTYIGDTIKITYIGYKPYQFVMGQGATPVNIYLKPDSLVLSKVFIKGHRNKKQDSLNMRKEFAKTFNYKGPGIGDVFIERSPYVKSDRPNNTSELVTINLLQVFSLLGKHKSNTSKLQNTLLKDEEESYISRMFTKEKIKGITNLSDDSLRVFMIKYRPDRQKASKMNDYDMLQYIRKSYAVFKKP